MKRTIVLEKDSNEKLVKEGFSWTTFFFGFFVPLFRRDWLHAGIFAGIVFVVSIVIGNILSIIEDEILRGTIRIIISIILATAFGKVYNGLYIKKLLKEGWKIKSDENSLL